MNHHDIYRACQPYSDPASGVFLYGLVDHGGMPGLAKKLDQANIEWVSLFAGSKEENALSVAPLLFRIDTDGSGVQHRALLNWVGENGAYTSSLLLLASPLSMHELAHRLTRRLDGVLPEDIEIMLRFFDPRIFEQLMQVLSAEQKQAFLSVAHRWWFADRRGKLQDVAAIFSEADIHEIPLMLTVAQENALLDASEPDQVAELLLSGVPDEYLALQPPQRHDFILRHVASARLLGITATHELALYCALALLHGEQFATQENWQSGLQGVLAGTMSLEQAAQQFEMNESMTGNT
jgi:hypothetical protein